MKAPATVTFIEKRIFMIRGQKIVLDSDLAVLYGIETFNLNKAVKRNNRRFPEDFMFQLTNLEMEDLAFQIGISSDVRHGGRRTRPFAFTEQGVAMLSGVLNTPKAIEANIVIMRAFVKLRYVFTHQRQLAEYLQKLENHLGKHDEEINSILHVMRRLMPPPVPKRKKIGFTAAKGERHV